MPSISIVVTRIVRPSRELRLAALPIPREHLTRVEYRYLYINCGVLLHEQYLILLSRYHGRREKKRGIQRRESPPRNCGEAKERCVTVTIKNYYLLLLLSTTYALIRRLHATLRTKTWERGYSTLPSLSDNQSRYAFVMYISCRNEKEAHSSYRRRRAKEEAGTDKLHERASPATRGGFCTDTVPRLADAGANS